MKKIVLSLACLSLCSFGCDSNPSSSPSQTLIGKWVWVYSFGGFSGGYIYPTPGVESTISFTTNGGYSSHRNDTLVVSAKYLLSLNDGSFPLKEDTILTIYERTPVHPRDTLPHIYGLHYSSNRLYLQQPGADVYRIVYERVN